MRWLLIVACLAASPVWAVDPSEMLNDPILEERARNLSKEVRCPVCQNESIDESHAPVAQQLREIIRERLVAGDTDAQILDYLTARFGEFVLLTPTRDGANLVLWLAAPFMLILGGAVAFSAIRRKAAQPSEALCADEEAQVEKILRS